MSRELFVLATAAFVWIGCPDEKKRPERGTARISDATEPRSADAPAEHSMSISDPTNAPGRASIDRAARGVLGGVHDFSTLTGRVVDACSACHVPHVQSAQSVERNGNPAILELFRLRSEREVFEPGRNMPGASSLICLSCHNGNVASSTIGTSHALMADFVESATYRRDFVIRDHPIGVHYPSGRKGYRSLAAVQARGGVPLPEGRVECISCHDQHNGAGVEHMLVMSNRRSALCMVCHEK